ncbi:hypothetical protein D3C87_751990 [compost metagenome]
MRAAASLASPPVDRNSDFDSDGGSIAASRPASAGTAGPTKPLYRCSAPSQAFSMAATMRGWLWPMVAHIWPEVKSRISRPLASHSVAPRALTMTCGLSPMP